jgi:4-hydroxybenzoate polyprenyltransferase
MKFSRTLKLFQLLSIDIVLGALAVGAFAIHLLGVSAQPAWWFVLPTAVWVIYTSDHLIDSFSKKNQATIDRHLFHFQNRKILSILVLIIGFSSATLSFLYLDKQIVMGGAALSVLVLLYFLAIPFLKKKFKFIFQKELLIAFVYTAGIFLAPLVWYGEIPGFTVIFLICNLFFLAFVETIMNSFFDFELDMNDRHTSFTTHFGKRKTEAIVFFILFILFFISSILFFIQIESTLFTALFLEIIMIFLLMTIMIFKNYFQKNSRYRWIGEGIF